MVNVLLTNTELSTTNSIEKGNLIAWLKVSEEGSSNLDLHSWDKYKPQVSLFDSSLEKPRNGDSYVLLPIQRIVRIECISGVTTIFTFSKKEYFTTPLSIGYLEDILSSFRFFRIHSNHLINIDYINKFVRCNAFVTLSNSETLPVSLGNDRKIIDFLEKKALL